jgi:Flp pilus assembly protein TadB
MKDNINLMSSKKRRSKLVWLSGLITVLAPTLVLIYLIFHWVGSTVALIFTALLAGFLICILLTLHLLLGEKGDDNGD